MRQTKRRLWRGSLLISVLLYALAAIAETPAARPDRPKWCRRQVTPTSFWPWSSARMADDSRVPRMQAEVMTQARAGRELVFVGGEATLPDVDKRSLQRPRVFYRRAVEDTPLVVARTPDTAK